MNCNTWQLPPEPGAEVKVLRDQWGRLWRRARSDAEYWMPVPDETKHERQRLTKGRAWHVLLSMGGVLTDATEEMAA